MKRLYCMDCDWSSDAPTHNQALAETDTHWASTGHSRFFRKGDLFQSTESSDQ